MSWRDYSFYPFAGNARDALAKPWVIMNRKENKRPPARVPAVWQAVHPIA
jgi:hypothetical protein